MLAVNTFKVVDVSVHIESIQISGESSITFFSDVFLVCDSQILPSESVNQSVRRNKFVARQRR